VLVREVEGHHAGRLVRAPPPPHESEADLKKLRLAHGSGVCLVLLQANEVAPPASYLLLQLAVRDPVAHGTSAPVDFVWDAKDDASLDGLKKVVAELTGIPAQHQKLAKHVRDKFKWRVLTNQAPPKRKGAKGKGKSRAPDLREAPANLVDGDTIAVKDSRLDAKVGVLVILFFVFPFASFVYSFIHFVFSR
jgi:hypothetical protein